jgi:hypothetical protein
VGALLATSAASRLKFERGLASRKIADDAVGNAD